MRSHIIQNWESQDEPKHLRTIRDRLLFNQQQAGRLLSLYQQVLQTEEIEDKGTRRWGDANNKNTSDSLPLPPINLNSL
ncbi:hypothetical protein [Nostoc sp.]|uniref:hypothetical protein n=1 Tax=Nostoc sp. TaxID=1180 RepID=UPI002FFA6CC7